MRRVLFAIAGLAVLACAAASHAQSVRVKDLGRFQGGRDSALIGYGVVTGLAGSGDSPRSDVTRQALKNVLSRFGANVTVDQVRSRNVAAVMVMAALPASANAGDRLDVTVSSIGDARSLVGGALLMTPLLGPDQKPYALAQGPLIVGGYRYDAAVSLEQKNHPTSGVISGGATVEVTPDRPARAGDLTFVLDQPDVTTAERLADAINQSLGAGVARVRDSSAVTIGLASQRDLYRTIARIEGLSISPDEAGRVVVNERTGTIVAGGDVRISPVVISQGDIRVSVSVDNQASQPVVLGGYAPNAASLIVSNTRLDVRQPRQDAVARFPSSTVADLVEGLARVHVDTRGMIAILQAMKAAGALHADIVIQ